MIKKERMKNQQPTVVARVTHEQKQEIEHWLVDNKQSVPSMQDLIMRGIMLVMDEAKHKKSKPSKKTAYKETDSAYNLHNAPFQEWVERVILVFNSCNSGAMLALAGNLVGFMAALAGLQQRGIIVDINNGSNENAPDYAAEAEAAQDSYEQLRRLLEGMRKGGRGVSQE